MKIIDAIGLDCPKPVIITKKYVDENNPDELKILVDNKIATENLSKFATEIGYSTEVLEKDGNFEVTLIREDIEMAYVPNTDNSDYIVVLSSDKMGDGEDEFSKKLLEGFVYALKEQEQLPKAIICYNLGVMLSSKNKNKVNDLRELTERGVKVYSCGLCLNYYLSAGDLEVGEVTNMFEIIKMMKKYKVVKPC